MASFVWVELNTTDPEAAAEFYGRCIGWTTQAYPGNGAYRQFMAGERPAGGLMLLPEPARARGPRWAGYIGVADVDAEAESIRDAGGSVHLAPQDIPTVGRFAVVGDPQGAVFMLITPLPREAPLPLAPGTPGHAAWHELHTSNWPAAFAFYAGRFGWTKDRAVDMGTMGTYQIFAIDGQQAGAMFDSPLPRPMWLHYFAVADIDAAADAIGAGGGSVLHGPVEVPGGSLIVQATDPQGAMFAVVGPRKT